jgi:hypothetical protein
MKKFYEFLTKNFKNFTMPFIFILGGFGIGCAVVGHYLQFGFRPVWFFCFDVPLYLFCIWVFWQIGKLVKVILENEKREE